MFRTHSQSGFDIQRNMLVFIQQSPFFASISRQLRKVCTRDIPTAGVSYLAARDELVLWYNDEFMSSLTDTQVHGVLTHEFYHIVFRHITSRMRPRMRIWNIATDMAINCLIWQEAEAALRVRPGGFIDADNIPLPLSGMTPGKFPDRKSVV